MARYHSRCSWVAFVVLSLFHLMQVSLSAQNVLDLTERNFDSASTGENPLLVDFYARWCSHCVQVSPFFDKAAAQLKSELPQVTLGKVDCTKSKALCDKYGVKFIPTIQLFYQGKPLEKMSDDKTPETIVAYTKTTFQTLRTLMDKTSSAQATPKQ